MIRFIFAVVFGVAISVGLANVTHISNETMIGIIILIFLALVSVAKP